MGDQRRKQGLQDDKENETRTYTDSEVATFRTEDYDANPSQFTFYREGTPDQEKKRDTPKSTPLIIPADGAVLAFLDMGPPNSDSEAGQHKGNEGSGRVCGLRRHVLGRVVVAAVVLIVVLAVGLGLGLGIPRRIPRGGPVTAADSSTPTPDATPLSGRETRTSSTTMPTTGPATTSEPSLPTSLAVAECPEANGTTFAVPGATSKALILCGIDYSSSRGEAVELGQLRTDTMADCIQKCANFPACTACGWGFIDGDSGDSLRCWLKGNLAQYHTARANWSFAILQPAPG